MAKNKNIINSNNNENLHDFGYDITSRTIYLIGDIDKDSYHTFVCNMTALENQNHNPIKIILKTDGGEIDSGIGIIERIKLSPCEINITAQGYVASIGIFILASGDKRNATSLTNFMHHESSYTMDDKHKTNKAYVKHMENEDIKLCKWLSKQTKKDFKFWKDLGVSIDHYFTSEHAYEYGLIDEIIEI